MNTADLLTYRCPLCARSVRMRDDGLLAWHLPIAGPKRGFVCTGALKTLVEAHAIQNWRLQSDKVLDGVLADLGGV